MEYSQLSALVPQGEHFDASAVNEGVWLSQGHLQNVENVLSANASALQAAKDEGAQQLAAAVQQNETAVNDANAKVTAAETAQAAAEASLATANDTIAARDTRITQLETELAEARKGPATEFETTTREKDELGGGGKVPFHASEENPMNKLADRLIPKKP